MKRIGNISQSSYFSKIKEVVTLSDLIVYKKSQELAGLAHKFIEALPNREFDLISQMKKSLYSIPLNIAEGAGRNTTKQFVYFLNVAQGSIVELEAQYQICIHTGLSKPDPELYDKIDHVGRLLNKLIKSLEKRLSNN